MDPGGHQLQEPGVGSAAQMPFERHLRSYNGSVPTSALASPLPLPNLETGDKASAQNLFVLSCETVEAEIIGIKGNASASRLQPVHWLSLLHIYDGTIVLTQNDHSVTARSGDWVIIPGETTHWQSSPFSVVCLMLSSSEIDQTCERMTCWSGHCQLRDWPLTRLGTAATDIGGVESLVLRALERTLQMIGDLMDTHPHLILQLKLEEQLGRLVALLLRPELREPLPGDGPEPDDENSLLRRFDDLLSYIDNNLDKPLNLTMLQSRIHYSRRAVQYAFQKRLGCTATQWIRARRLDRAHELLRHANTEDSVSRVAQTCGYRSMSLFSIDFQQRFHIKPSTLLRHGRSERTGDGPTQSDQGESPIAADSP